MITETYVSFEVAKLLKEKGFDEECYTFYECNSEDFYHNERIPCCNSHSDEYAAPTQQRAMKWLRKEKGIAIVPIVSSILDDEKFIWDIEIIVAKTHDTYHQSWTYETYEGAAEAGIKLCLKNLI